MLNGRSESHSYFERVSFPWRPLDHSQHPCESRDPRGLSPGDVSVDRAGHRRDSWLLAGSGEISAVHIYYGKKRQDLLNCFVVFSFLVSYLFGICYFEPASRPDCSAGERMLRCRWVDRRSGDRGGPCIKMLSERQHL